MLILGVQSRWVALALTPILLGALLIDDTAFDQLRRTVEELDQLRGTGGNMAFYLAIPPAFFGNVVGQLKEHGLADPGPDQWRRVVIEEGMTGHG